MVRRDILSGGSRGRNPSAVVAFWEVKKSGALFMRHSTLHLIRAVNEKELCPCSEGGVLSI